MCNATVTAKIRFVVVLVGLLFALDASTAWGQVSTSTGDPRVAKVVPIHHVFVVPWYADGDVVKLPVDGTMPNLCHTVTVRSLASPVLGATPPAGPDGLLAARETLKLEAKAERTHEVCAAQTSTFEASVNVGRLSAGVYDVADSDGTVLAKLPVSPREPNLCVRLGAVSSGEFCVDPPVNDVRLERIDDRYGSEYAVSLSWVMTNSCLYIEETRLEVSGDIIGIFPVAKMSRSSDCRPVEVPIRTWVTLPPLAAGKYLIHVGRGSDEALQKIVTVSDQRASG